MVEDHLKHRTKILQSNIQNILKAQNRLKIQADKKKDKKIYKEELGSSQAPAIPSIKHFIKKQQKLTYNFNCLPNF